MKKNASVVGYGLLHKINLFLSVNTGCFSFFFSLFFHIPLFSGFEPTADDGRTPKQPPGMYKAKVVNNGIDSYQPQLVSLPDFSHQQYQPSTVHPRRSTAGTYSHHPWKERNMIIWTKPPGNYVQNVNLQGCMYFFKRNFKLPNIWCYQFHPLNGKTPPLFPLMGVAKTATPGFSSRWIFGSSFQEPSTLPWSHEASFDSDTHGILVDKKTPVGQCFAKEHTHTHTHKKGFKDDDYVWFYNWFFK